MIYFRDACRLALGLFSGSREHARLSPPVVTRLHSYAHEAPNLFHYGARLAHG